MRQSARGWIMPEADILSLLRLIDERVSSPEIEAQHGTECRSDVP
jgi:hypothetical protein